MVKKVIAIGAAGLMLLSVAGPAFGWFSSNVAIVNNNASAVANTGGNSQGNFGFMVGGNNNMTTGGADAYAGALVVANTHVSCCWGGGMFDSDFAVVNNAAGAAAGSGLNGQGNAGFMVGGNNNMTTKGAGAETHAWTIVNTHLSF